MPEKSRKKRRIVWGVLLSSPAWLCLLLLGWQWLYETIELMLLDARVDDAAIPGYVLSKDGRNDWPFGTSNGAYVRINWMIASKDKNALETFAKRIETSGLDDGVRVELKELGEIGDPLNDSIGREAFTFVDDARLYLLRVSYARDNEVWEEFPGD